MASPAPRHELGQVRVGDDDRRSHIGDAEQLGELTAVIANAGHMSNMEQTEHINAQARRFCLEPT